MGSLTGILQPSLTSPKTTPPCPWWRQVETGHCPANPCIFSLISSSRSSHPHWLPWSSSIDGRRAPVAPTLQSAFAGLCTLPPWPGSRVWTEARTTGQWSTARWSCSSTATRRLWSEPLSALSCMAARVQRRLYQSLGVGQCRSHGDGLPSRPSDLGTRTPGRRTRKATMSQGNVGRGSGSRGGKAPRWGDVRSEGCSLDMLLWYHGRHPGYLLGMRKQFFNKWIKHFPWLEEWWATITSKLSWIPQLQSTVLLNISSFLTSLITALNSGKHLPVAPVKNRAESGAWWGWSKNNKRSLSVSDAWKGISLARWHHSDSQHLLGELRPCSSLGGGVGFWERVFKGPGGLPAALAHTETRESLRCCHDWQQHETHVWGLKNPTGSSNSSGFATSMSFSWAFADEMFPSRWQNMCPTTLTSSFVRNILTFSQSVHNEGEPGCAGMQHILEFRQAVLGSERITPLSCVFWRGDNPPVNVTAC